MEFKDIPWFEWLYKITNCWIVKAIKRQWTDGRINIWYITKNWYKIYNLFKNWKQYKFKAHRLVLLTFIWASKLIVNHKDWNKLNNNIDNLEYCTYSENNKHAYKIWLRKKRFWKDNIRSIQVTNWFNFWDSINLASKELWLDPSSITKCCKWKLKTCGWFNWKYI